MGVKDRWVSSKNGPDWTDIRVVMRSIQETHQCAVYLEIMPGSTPLGPELRCVLTAISNSPGADLRVCEEAVAVSWPRGWNSSMQDTIFALCYSLEARLTELWWVQGEYQLP